MSNLNINQSKEIGQELSFLYASNVKGEPYHSEYKKDKEIFRKLISSELRLKKDLKKHFSDLSTKIIPYINWYELDKKIRKANEYDDLVQYDFEEEKKNLSALLIPGLIIALNAGGNSVEKEFNISVDWSPISEPLNTFVNKRAKELATQLTDTTYGRALSSLKSSYANYETIEEAIQRITEVIQDPYRAETIARTESINAFADGRIEAGGLMGATHKEWSSTYKACPICAPLDGVVVEIEDSFGFGVYGPAAHPNCRCYVRLLFK